MLFTDYLYENSKEVWDKYLEHPFNRTWRGDFRQRKV